mmetsp:Transcript_22313/g.49816  ORF Transcript_22313/g.49816 Transcript_22313/m.49816 type:complete len:250 (-) Transcript_22313:561-1310(-)
MFGYHTPTMEWRTSSNSNNNTSNNMDNHNYNDNVLATPRKRKQPEERDDYDIVPAITPSSSFSSNGDDDDLSLGDSSHGIETREQSPIFAPSFGMSTPKRRRIETDIASCLSPPPLPRYQRDCTTVGSLKMPSTPVDTLGRVDLSFLAIPSPPSDLASTLALPTVALSPRTTLTPRFFQMGPRRLFGDARDMAPVRPRFATIRRRKATSSLAPSQSLRELSLPTLEDPRTPERKQLKVSPEVPFPSLPA